MSESDDSTDDQQRGGAGWDRARRALRPQDHTLLGASRRWIRRLPPRRRPVRLATRHPRIVNRIAWCWNDVSLCTQVLDDLLTDRRGGRTGFPSPIVHELRRLQRFNAERPISTAAGSGPGRGLAQAGPG